MPSAPVRPPTPPATARRTSRRVPDRRVYRHPAGPAHGVHVTCTTFGDGWEHDVHVLGPGAPKPGCIQAWASARPRLRSAPRLRRTPRSPGRPHPPRTTTRCGMVTTGAGPAPPAQAPTGATSAGVPSERPDSTELGTAVANSAGVPVRVTETEPGRAPPARGDLTGPPAARTPPASTAVSPTPMVPHTSRAVPESVPTRPWPFWARGAPDPRRAPHPLFCPPSPGKIPPLVLPGAGPLHRGRPVSP
jgi:hypothetical protein